MDLADPPTAPVPASRESRYRQCVLCLEDRHPQAFRNRNMTSSCLHKNGVCRRCQQEYIRNKLSDSNLQDIECPECDGKMTYADVQIFTSKPLFKRYDEKLTLSMLSELSEDGGAQWIPCSSASCNLGQLHENPEAWPIMTCIGQRCKAKTCALCKVPWHEGLTCTQYRDSEEVKKQQEIATQDEKHVTETYSRCPNSQCGFFISKNGGCDHMTCTRCRHEFCWLCSADYNEIRRNGNDAHHPDCKFHPSRLPSNSTYTTHQELAQARNRRNDEVIRARERVQ